MAPLLEDPRFRQTWNQLSQNAEEATETAATSIWNFQHHYINPCFASIASGFQQCTGLCIPDREERARRLRERGRTRGRAELSFDFYDDWDDDDGGRSSGLLGGWGNDELDRLLAGSGSQSGGKGADKAPRRKRGMSYGTRSNRRKSLEPDPTIIPSTNSLGFLGRLPFKLGGTLRYKPSAADLQDHPGASREEYRAGEGEPLISDDNSEDDRDRSKNKGHRRQRSSTTSSGETSDSFRSRGDLFASDGDDDAVPLDDEFAMVLERRMTGEDRITGKPRSSKGKRPAGSRTVSTATHSSRSRPRLESNHSNSAASLALSSDPATPDMTEAPSLTDLHMEEERIRMEEDEEVERKRNAAIRLAVERGLQADGPSDDIPPEDNSKHDPLVEDRTTPSSDVANGYEEVLEEEHSAEELHVAEPAKDDISHDKDGEHVQSSGFIPARLPHFS